MIQVLATDADEPNNYNSDLRYRILSQDPALPNDRLFEIQPITGAITVNAVGLDREVRDLKTYFAFLDRISMFILTVENVFEADSYFPVCFKRTKTDLRVVFGPLLNW